MRPFQALILGPILPNFHGLLILAWSKIFAYFPDNHSLDCFHWLTVSHTLLNLCWVLAFSMVEQCPHISRQIIDRIGFKFDRYIHNGTSFILISPLMPCLTSPYDDVHIPLNPPSCIRSQNAGVSTWPVSFIGCPLLGCLCWVCNYVPCFITSLACQYEECFVNTEMETIMLLSFPETHDYSHLEISVCANIHVHIEMHK